MVTPDGGIDKEFAQAMFLALWDGKNQETLKMDSLDKRNACRSNENIFHQTLVSMSETYFKATQDEKMTATIKDFCDYFCRKN